MPFNPNSKQLVAKAVSTRFLLPLVGLLAAFPPIATSMYLPAMPYFQSLWGVELKIINLTLVFFYLSYCTSLLAYGPISDCIGRRPPLIVGILIFIFGSLVCSGSTSVTHLIFGRIFQGLGAAGPSALALSIIKDKYSGPGQKKMLAAMGLIISLAPMAGPLLGSWILKFAQWQVIFFIQIVIALVALVCVIKLPETLINKEKMSWQEMVRPYAFLMSNRRFVLLNFSIATSTWPMFAFIATSPDIYIVRHGVSQQAYGFYFAITSMALMIGAMICVRVSEIVDEMIMIRLGFGGMCIGGLVLWFTPISHPVMLTAVMFFVILSFGLTRPFSISMVLNTVDRYSGASSSLIMFANFTMGAISAWFISLGWADAIPVIGIMSFVSGLLALFLTHRVNQSL